MPFCLSLFLETLHPLMSSCVCLHLRFVTVGLATAIKGTRYFSGIYLLLFRVDTANRMCLRWLLASSGKPRCCSASASRGPSREPLGCGPLCLCAMCFHLALPLPICEQRCFYKSIDKANQLRASVCVCVRVCLALASVTYEETSPRFWRGQVDPASA